MLLHSENTESTNSTLRLRLSPSRKLSIRKYGWLDPGRDDDPLPVPSSLNESVLQLQHPGVHAPRTTSAWTAPSPMRWPRRRRSRQRGRSSSRSRSSGRWRSTPPKAKSMIAVKSKSTVATPPTVNRGPPAPGTHQIDLHRQWIELRPRRIEVDLPAQD